MIEENNGWLRLKTEEGYRDIVLEYDKIQWMDFFIFDPPCENTVASINCYCNNNNDDIGITTLFEQSFDNLEDAIDVQIYISQQMKKTIKERKINETSNSTS